MYVEKLEKYGQRELCRQLMLGDYFHGRVVENDPQDNDNQSTLYLYADKNNGAYCYTFNDHSLTNVTYKHVPILKKGNNEFALIDEIPQANEITKAYIHFMTLSFGDSYSKRTYDYRSARIEGLIESLKKTMDVYTTYKQAKDQIDYKIAKYNTDAVPVKLTNMHVKLYKFLTIIDSHIKYIIDEIKFNQQMQDHILEVSSDNFKNQIKEEKEKDQKSLTETELRKLLKKHEEIKAVPQTRVISIDEYCKLINLNIQSVIDDAKKIFGLPEDLPIEQILFPENLVVEYTDINHPVFKMRLDNGNTRELSDKMQEDLKTILGQLSDDYEREKQEKNKRQIGPDGFPIANYENEDDDDESSK